MSKGERNRVNRQIRAPRVRMIDAESHTVEVTIRFRGREISRMDLGERLLQRLHEELGDRGVVDFPVERAGSQMRQVFAPPRQGGRRPPGRTAGGDPEDR